MASVNACTPSHGSACAEAIHYIRLANYNHETAMMELRMVAVGLKLLQLSAGAACQVGERLVAQLAGKTPRLIVYCEPWLTNAHAHGAFHGKAQTLHHDSRTLNP